MTDKEINTNKYFVELTDIGGGTIGYTVPFPEELLREIIKQNKQLSRKTAECEKYKQALNEIELSVTNLISSCDKCPDNKNGYCIGIDGCSSKCFKKLFDIISKAKDGNK